MKIQVVKFGSNCLFKGDELDYDVLRKNWAEQFKIYEGETGVKTYIKASGAVAMAKRVRNDKRSNKDISLAELIWLAGIGQHKLMNFYDEIFQGLYDVSQLLITENEEDYFEERQSFVNSVYFDLNKGTIPVSNYNDRLSFKEVRKDNDVPAAKDAVLLSAVRCFLIGKGDYTGLLDRGGKVIKDVFGVTSELYQLCKGRSTNGTGGMESKLDAARICNDAGIDMIIGNVNFGFLNHIERSVENTYFHANGQKTYK